MAEYKGSIPKSFIQDLLARSDIIQVIGQRVPLKKAGGSFKACCPFHGEKTPSFNVSAQKQFYHCFGCGASGDSLKFMMEYDGLSFVEAVESLASLMGIEVPREKISPQAMAQQKKQNDLYDVMHLAAKFYRQQLGRHASSSTAKHYLVKRGVTSEVAKQFVIGLAPAGWDNLWRGLVPSGKDDLLKQQLIENGLLIEKDGGGVYDRFRERIMFPIRDGRGRVIGFGGRVMGDEQPKYLNSPETPIFHKGNTLYGLYEMRQSREAYEHVIVVEGYMDVVSLAQFGVGNSVATLGTATTQEHLELLFREVKQVVFCFDGDSAGLKAAWKALTLALPIYTGERLIKFLFLDEGEDPDSVIRTEGKEGFVRRVASAMLMSEFLFEKLRGELNVPLSSSEGKQQLVAKVQPFILTAPASFQDALAQQLSDFVELPVWKLSKIMGIQVSGSRQFDNNKKKGTDVPASIVTNETLKLIAVLYLRPSWADVFDSHLLALMRNSSSRQYHFLVKLVEFLRDNLFVSESLNRFFSDSGHSKVFDKMKTIPLLNDDEFLSIEFDLMVQKMAKELLKKKKPIQGGEDLTSWFNEQKNSKN